MNKIISSIFFIALFLHSFSQSAPWISYPTANNTTYGVYHFRKTFEINKVPKKLVINISADNRYNLFVNGKRVCYGPAKGDLKTYKYDVVDIATYLKVGKNVIAALVYNGGKDKPLAFISAQTAFMFRVENKDFRHLSSDETWKTYKNPAYKVIYNNELIFNNRWYYGFYACGGNDDMSGDKYPWGWEQPGFDDSSWESAEYLTFEGSAPWQLFERNISFMDNHREQPSRIRKVTGCSIPVGNWNGKKTLTIPANSSTSILIDFDIFTMGYPELTVDRGKNSAIKIKYAEALYEKVDVKAAHRDSIDSKTMFGFWDIFRPDGEAQRTFRPLWKRAFRYVQLVIETKEEPLEIVSFENEYSGYPYPEMATFKSNNERVNRIFEICQRTLRMCSAETYYDTPFYEQLSYGGDNRPITATSTYNTTDDRLLREMLRLYPQSENRETGLFKSAYPSRFDFDMAGWSLAWVQTLYDYYQIRGDSSFVRQFTPKIEGVLRFFERHLDECTGLNGPIKADCLLDWSVVAGAIPRKDGQGVFNQSAMLSLYYAHTLDCAVKLFSETGQTDKTTHWTKILQKVKDGVIQSCWDEDKLLFRDTPDKPVFSQHTNLLAILCDLIPEDEQVKLLHRILNNDSLDEVASSYFSFFLFKAMQKTGQEDLFLDHLNFWYGFLDKGLTTCGETGFASHDRSDCHAWSAHPAYFLLNSVCGIKPGDIGFNSIRISPHLGSLTNVKASMPHPKGRIEVDYKIERGKLSATVNLPTGLSGEWYYHGDVIPLHEGINKID